MNDRFDFSSHRFTRMKHGYRKISYIRENPGSSVAKTMELFPRMAER
jgi:hypothetical protein